MLRYAILDATTRPGHVARLAADGVDYLQLRAKSLPTAKLLTLAQNILAELAEVPNAPTRLLINSRPDIALIATLASGTPVGVHLTSNPSELTPQQVRILFSSTPYSLLLTPCISISCHTLHEVRQAASGGADLILFGPVFEKRVARQFIHDGSGLTALTAAVQAANSTPVLALGGITHENTFAGIAAGAAGIAAIRLFSS